MEKINLPTLSACNSISEDHAIKRVASAVEWLFDQKPSIPFVNTKAITKYINKALSLRPRNSLSISLPDELAIYHPDFRKDNFLINATTERICTAEFKHTGVPPKPFQEYGFFSVDFFATAVGRRLGLQRSDIVYMVAEASVILQQMGRNASLGLNEFGERSSTKPNCCRR